jgi:predicted DNA-binding protein
MQQMVSTRLDPEIKKLLEKMAKEQKRPLSNLVRLIILEWLEFKEIEIPKSKK